METCLRNIPACSWKMHLTLHFIFYRMNTHEYFSEQIRTRPIRTTITSGVVVSPILRLSKLRLVKILARGHPTQSWWSRIRTRAASSWQPCSYAQRKGLRHVNVQCLLLLDKQTTLPGPLFHLQSKGHFPYLCSPCNNVLKAKVCQPQQYGHFGLDHSSLWGRPL